MAEYLVQIEVPSKRKPDLMLRQVCILNRKNRPKGGLKVGDIVFVKQNTKSFSFRGYAKVEKIDQHLLPPITIMVDNKERRISFEVCRRASWVERILFG